MPDCVPLGSNVLWAAHQERAIPRRCLARAQLYTLVVAVERGEPVGDPIPPFWKVGKFQCSGMFPSSTAPIPGRRLSGA
jgi:hypothetical protein